MGITLPSWKCVTAQSHSQVRQGLLGSQAVRDAQGGSARCVAGVSARAGRGRAGRAHRASSVMPRWMPSSCDWAGTRSTAVQGGSSSSSASFTAGMPRGSRPPTVGQGGVMRAGPARRWRRAWPLSVQRCRGCTGVGQDTLQRHGRGAVHGGGRRAWGRTHRVDRGVVGRRASPEMSSSTTPGLASGTSFLGAVMPPYLTSCRWKGREGEGKHEVCVCVPEPAEERWAPSCGSPPTRVRARAHTQHTNTHTHTRTRAPTHIHARTHTPHTHARAHAPR